MSSRVMPDLTVQSVEGRRTSERKVRTKYVASEPCSSYPSPGAIAQKRRRGNETSVVGWVKALGVTSEGPDAVSSSFELAGTI